MNISQSETTEVDFPNCIFFFLLIIQLLILCKQCCQTVDRSFAPPLNSMSSGEHLHMLSLVCLFRRITNYAIIIGCCIYVDVKTHWCALERGEPLMSSLQGNLIKLPIWLLVFVRKNNNKILFSFAGETCYKCTFTAGLKTERSFLFFDWVGCILFLFIVFIFFC